MEEQKKEIESKIYPTTPDKEGLFYESEEDFDMGIKTIVYPNGNITKKVELSGGRIATVRTLFGRDNSEITKILNNDRTQYQNAQMAVATCIDDVQLLIEDVLSMKLKDLNKIMIAHSAINF